MGSDSDYLEDRARRALCLLATTAKAETHLKASGVYPMSEPDANSRICECCNMRADLPPIPLGVDIEKLQELGSAFPLLFYYTKGLAGVLAVVFLVSSLPQLGYNLYLYSEFSEERKTIAATTLGGNLENIDDFAYWPAILNLIIVIILAPTIPLLTYHMRKKANQLKMKKPGQAANSILVQNLKTFNVENQETANSRETGSDTEESKWTAEKIIEGLKTILNQEQVNAEIFFTFRLSDYMQNTALLRQKLTAWARDKRTRETQETERNADEQQELAQSASAVKCEVKGLLKKREGLKKNFAKTGMAIIMFKSPITKVLRDNIESLKLNFLLELGHLITGMNHPFHYEGRNIVVESAPEPFDIEWENFQYGRTNRYLRQVLGYVVLLVLLGASVGLLYGVADWANYDSEGGKHYNKFLPPAVIIVIGNIVILLCIQKIAFFERHYTHTGRIMSVATNLTIVLSINTLLFPYLVCEGSDEGYSAGLLGSKIFWVAVVSWVNTLIRIYHPFRVCRLVQKWRLNRNLTKRGFATQARANELYQQEEFDIADCYSDQMIRFLLAMTYAPIVPLVVPVTLLGYLVDYWANKWILLRRSCRPKCLDKEITERMLIFLNPALVLFAVVSLVALRSLREDTQSLGITAVCISVVSIFLNIYQYIYFARKNSSVSPSTDSSSDPPSVTYQAANPATRSGVQEPSQRLTTKEDEEDLKPAFMFKAMMNPRVRMVIKEAISQAISQAIPQAIPQIIVADDRGPMNWE